MRHAKAGLALAMLAALLVPGSSSATGTVITNPFGNLQMTVSGNTATLTIVTANGTAFKTSSQTERIYFGLRIMGTEDVEMTGFSLSNTTGGCIVSDFKGTNTSGWQGKPVFEAGHPAVGSPNSHMRMIGGFLQKNCGNVTINISFRARPVVVYYAAFYGYTAAPWHENYGTPPWTVVPAGPGGTANQQWWNLWGTFTDLGYSNSCTNVSGTAVNCA